MDSSIAPYDEVPYESNPFAQTHPNRLATVASLLGMKPKPIERCRVLELGCASGGNLIPMAIELPGSEFVGIDLSALQIDESNEILRKLDIKNVRLEHCNIADIDKKFGLFDYIICHGVFSWVPFDIQDKILEICRENLSWNGVAYVSYNALPGWHMRGMIRDMMCYHTARFTDNQMKVEQARALIDFLLQSVTNEKSAYAIWLKEEFELLKKVKNYYIFHDHLEDNNDALYFHQFIERAQKKYLQYLGEADFQMMLGINVPPKTDETLRKLFPDSINYEQYLDFVRNRMFRQTLLVHNNIILNRNVKEDRINNMLVACSATPVSGGSGETSNMAQEFKNLSGLSFNTGSMITKTAIKVLAEYWPKPILFIELLSLASSRIGKKGEGPSPLEGPDAVKLKADLLYLYASGIVELHSYAPPFVSTVSELPIASPFARFQAEKGLSVTNLRHELIMLDEPMRRVLLMLDGKHRSQAIFDNVCEMIEKGILVANKGGVPTNVETVKSDVESLVNQMIIKLANQALLMN